MNENSQNKEIKEQQQLNDKSSDIDSVSETNNKSSSAIPLQNSSDAECEIKSEKVFSKGKKIFIIAFSVFILITLTLCSLILFEINGKNLKEEISVKIPKGSPSVTVANLLKENDIINSSLLFRVYGKLKGFENQFKYGTYSFKGRNSYKDICSTLITKGDTAPSVTVTIPEGTSVNDYTKNVNGKNVTVPGIATILEKAGVCEKEDFFDALKSVDLNTRLLSNANQEKAYFVLEGYLFPETYDFYNYDSKECAKLAVAKMLKESENRITDEMYKRAKELGYSMNEILTLASIVQLESGQNANEMPNVAAVFYNRLKANQKLGSSPTYYYGSSFSGDDGRYNTYEIGGFPPGPLCSVGTDALKAALWPAQNSPYFYFVTDSKGKFYYHKTFQEQNNTISELKKNGNWIYEYF